MKGKRIVLLEGVQRLDTAIENKATSLDACVGPLEDVFD